MTRWRVTRGLVFVGVVEATNRPNAIMAAVTQFGATFHLTTKNVTVTEEEPDQP